MLIRLEEVLRPGKGSHFDASGWVCTDRCQHAGQSCACRVRVSGVWSVSVKKSLVFLVNVYCLMLFVLVSKLVAMTTHRCDLNLLYCRFLIPSTNLITCICHISVKSGFVPLHERFWETNSLFCLRSTGVRFPHGTFT